MMYLNRYEISARTSRFFLRRRGWRNFSNFMLDFKLSRFTIVFNNTFYKKIQGRALSRWRGFREGARLRKKGLYLSPRALYLMIPPGRGDTLAEIIKILKYFLDI